MNEIIKNYELLVKKYKEIEKESTEQEIHDRRVTLRRIFPILTVYKINISRLKNGEKAFKLFGKLRDIQVQLSKLENQDQTPEMIEYIAFLKEKEQKIQVKVHKFSKKKKLEFPSLKKKSKIETSKIVQKADKAFAKLVERIELRSIDDAEDIHKIRIKFKKFRYVIEILSYITPIEDEKLERLKVYQDKLGDIQDYEVLIQGITNFHKTNKPDEEANTEILEKEQNNLIEQFDAELDTFIGVCKDVISKNAEVVRTVDESIIENNFIDKI